MIKVKIFSTPARPDEKMKAMVVCILGWDDEKEEIVILAGKEYAKRMMEDRYLDKETMEHISFEDGKKFIMRLPYALTGTRVWASQTYEEK